MSLHESGADIWGSWQRGSASAQSVQCQLTQCQAECQADEATKVWAALCRLLHGQGTQVLVVNEAVLSAASPHQPLDWGMERTASALCKVTGARQKTCAGMCAACRGAENGRAQCRGMWRRENVCLERPRGWPGAGLERVTPRFLPLK